MPFAVKNILRRNGWLLLFVSAILIIGGLILYVTLIMHKSSNTVYGYYRISDGHNEGLSADDRDTFKLNGINVTLTSGTIHYFRVHPHYWRDRLKKLRAMGAVAVETYAPWNLHEPYKDTYDFGDGAFEMSEFLDIVKFIKIAKEEDLLVILRPGPYICAEFEFGGLPSYLLGDGAKVRTSDPKYMDRVGKYFDQLLPRVAPLQVYYGGPIIMIQVENEYGALLQPDHKYMVQLKQIIDKNGIKGLLFTADNAETDAGALPELGVLQTTNFQTDAEMQMSALRKLQPNKPVMVMEFWTGWFDFWDKPEHVTFNPKDYLETLNEILAFPASVNLYMFHGGTDFGFLNGANNDDTEDSYHPDTSSYDYDALVTEAGDYAVKYSTTMKLFRAVHPQLEHPDPPPLDLPRVLARSVKLTHELAWPDILKQLPEPKGELKNRDDFIFMEDVPVDERGNKQSFGYVHYKTDFKVTGDGTVVLRLTGRIRDIVIVLVDGNRQTIVLENGNQTTNEFGFWASKKEELELKVGPGSHTLELFVENCGRINYAKTVDWLMHKKGLGPDNQISLIGAEFTSGIDVTGMPFLSNWVSNLTDWQDLVVVGEKPAPSLVKGSFFLRDASDTFISVRDWRRGVVWVNGFNIGRFFAGGPQLNMYVPGPLLRLGVNTIIVFEHYHNAQAIELETEPAFLSKRNV